MSEIKKKNAGSDATRTKPPPLLRKAGTVELFARKIGKEPKDGKSMELKYMRSILPFLLNVWVSSGSLFEDFCETVIKARDDDKERWQ